MGVGACQITTTRGGRLPDPRHLSAVTRDQREHGAQDSAGGLYVVLPGQFHGGGVPNVKRGTTNMTPKKKKKAKKER